MNTEITNASLSSALQIRKGISAVIGSGGKTSLLRTLSLELSREHTVILATSTHFLPFPHCPLLLSEEPEPEMLRARLADSPTGILCVARHAENGKLRSPALPFSVLAELADYVLVEADGSKRLPLKAHAAHEPVIPEGSRQCICVVGASGFYRKIGEVVHRPEHFLSLARERFPELTIDSPAEPKHAAYVLTREGLADQVLLNQMELWGERVDEILREFSAHCPLPLTAASLLHEAL